MKVRRYFAIARKVAESGDSKDARRRYRLGAVGIRSDGVLVSASNICTRLPCPTAHAEYRVCKMITPNSTMFVVRVHRDGGFANARPCRSCVNAMKTKGVRKCYYTINECEYGVINL
jgi:tRNA(Arg) A34 adenosine deaminase TadA